MANKKTLVETLLAMKANRYLYAGKEYIVTGHSINGSKVTIKTDFRNFEKNLDELEDFLDLWQEVGLAVKDIPPANNSREVIKTDTIPEPPAKPIVPTNDEMLSNYLSSADSLIQILKENITKVQNNSAYVPQAAVVNNAVTNIISIEKLKLDAFKELKNLRPAHAN